MRPRRKAALYGYTSGQHLGVNKKKIIVSKQDYLSIYITYKALKDEILAIGLIFEAVYGLLLMPAMPIPAWPEL